MRPGRNTAVCANPFAPEKRRVRLALRSCVSACLVFALGCALPSVAFAAREAWLAEPLPPGFSVQSTELEGPVFADPAGRTLYRWPYKTMRNGITGDAPGQSACTDVKTTESAGLMSPYPGGFVLPDLESRPSCTQWWPPALADADAQPVGKWSLITRADGRRQWAYDRAALYTSVLDRRPGDVLGGDRVIQSGDFPAVREPIGPLPDLPPGFSIGTTPAGRMLLTERGFTVYVTDADRRGRVRCENECAADFSPLPAPGFAHPRGDWSVVVRASGEQQWAYRGRPLYRRPADPTIHGLEGTDVPGWHAVYVSAAEHPAEFTVQDNTAGQVLADAQGRTIYTYSCGDDATDQLGCDHPTETQAYRLGLCGAGDAKRCLANFPYVQTTERVGKRTGAWSVVLIDPLSGRFAERGAPGALRVWAFRDRPVYTYAGDLAPGDFGADAYGEFSGERSGYKSFWLRMDYTRNNQ